jgi:hypothetical protein
LKNDAAVSPIGIGTGRRPTDAAAAQEPKLEIDMSASLMVLLDRMPLVFFVSLAITPVLAVAAGAAI